MALMAESRVRTGVPLGNQQASLQPGPTYAAPPISLGAPTQLHPDLHHQQLYLYYHPYLHDDHSCLYHGHFWQLQLLLPVINLAACRHQDVLQI